MIVLGTIVPFALVVTALGHVSATRAGIAAMLEPPAATVVAFLWPRGVARRLPAPRRRGVLAAIALAQNSR
jgi:hypothetical protein